MRRRQFLTATTAAGALVPLLGAGQASRPFTPESEPEFVGGPLGLFRQYYRQSYAFPIGSGRRFELTGANAAPAPVFDARAKFSRVSLSGYAPTVETLILNRQRKLQELAASLLKYSAKFAFPFVGERTEQNKIIGFRHLLGQETKFARFEKLLFACGSTFSLVLYIRKDDRLKLVSGRPEGHPERYTWDMECSMTVYDNSVIGVA